MQVKALPEDGLVEVALQMPASEDERLVEAGPLLLAAALKGCTAAGPLAVVDMAGPDLALGLLAASTVWAQLILRCAHLREVRCTRLVLWSVGRVLVRFRS